MNNGKYQMSDCKKQEELGLIPAAKTRTQDVKRRKVEWLGIINHQRLHDNNVPVVASAGIRVQSENKTPHRRRFGWLNGIMSNPFFGINCAGGQNFRPNGCLGVLRNSVENRR